MDPSRLLAESPIHSVYELYDAAGSLLYVGRTSVMKERLKWHLKRPYGHLIDKVEVLGGLNEVQAAELEARLILTSNPAHNRVGINPSDKTQRGLRKVSDAQRLELVKRFEQGEPSTELARVFDISKSRVCQIVNEVLGHNPRYS